MVELKILVVIDRLRCFLVCGCSILVLIGVFLRWLMRLF